MFDICTFVHAISILVPLNLRQMDKYKFKSVFRAYTIYSDKACQHPLTTTIVYHKHNHEA